jgi:DNA-directed RNA polymerase specialized sigma24 family protein
MSEVTDEVLDILEKHPWEETVPRLVLHALHKMKRLYWQGVWGGPAPGGVEAEDLVQKSVEKVLSGKRSWDSSAQPDFFNYLKGVVDSEISHLVEEWENRFLRRETVLEGESGANEGFFTKVPCSNPGPEEVLLEKERERLSEQFFWEFFDYLKETPLLQKLLECISEGIDKRSEIAKKIGIPTKEYDNQKKQIQRRYRSFKEKKCGVK